MFKSGVASIGIFSLVGNSLISASTEVISPTTNEEKVASLLLDIQNGEVPLNEDVIYMKLIGNFPSDREFKLDLEKAFEMVNVTIEVKSKFGSAYERFLKKIMNGLFDKGKNEQKDDYLNNFRKQWYDTLARNTRIEKEHVQKINSLRKFILSYIQAPIYAASSGQVLNKEILGSRLAAGLTKDEAHSVLDFFDNLNSSDDSIDDNKLCGIVAYIAADKAITNIENLYERMLYNFSAYVKIGEIPNMLSALRSFGVVAVPIIREFLRSGEFSNYPLPVYPIESLRQLNTLKAAREREKLIDKKQDIWKQNVTEDKEEESKSKNKEKQSYENFLIGGTVVVAAICAIVAGVNYIKRWFSGKNEEVKHEAKSFPQQKLSDREAF